MAFGSATDLVVNVDQEIPSQHREGSGWTDAVTTEAGRKRTPGTRLQNSQLARPSALACVSVTIEGAAEGNIEWMQRGEASLPDGRHVHEEPTRVSGRMRAKIGHERC